MTRKRNGYQSGADKEVFMKEKQLIVTKSELESIVYEEVQKERHMLFDLCLEDYALLPLHTYGKRRGKQVVTVPLDGWENLLEQYSQVLGDLMIAREIIKKIKPVYDEYQKTYEKEHGFELYEYIKMVNTLYDSDEFERVRDQFEEEYNRQLDENALER